MFHYLVFSLACTTSSSEVTASEVADELDANGVPTVAALFARHDQAMGEMPRHRARRTAYQFVLPDQNLMGTTTVWLAFQPDRLYEETSRGPMGVLRRSWDGSVGWAVEPMRGARLLSNEEVAVTRWQLDRDSWSDSSEHYDGLHVIGHEIFDARSTWRVDGTFRPTGDPISLWFDTTSELLAGFGTRASEGAREVVSTTTFHQYADQGGYLLPSLVMSRTMGQQQRLQLVEHELDPEALPDFAMPYSVRALLSER